jgi:hypothetical protein
VEFRLTFPIPLFKNKISYRDKILLAGSCFAENIGELMVDAKLNCLVNPNGIVYNPISIANHLQRVLIGDKYKEDELFNYNELWGSWQHHGEYSNTDKGKTLTRINKDFNIAENFINEGDWLIVTFGSAYVYRLKTSNEIAANCHKYPNTEFTKELLFTDEIVSTWQNLISQIGQKNPKLKIILTVSPVRYVRDGLVNNNLSKAILLQAVHELCKLDAVNYFPAYELVLDDLRDYRFFTQDLVHPNAQAIHYVWEKFADTLFSEDSKTIYNKVKPLVSAAKHRVLHAGTEAHKKFLATHLQKVIQLQKEYPFLAIEDLEEAFRK